LPTTTLPTSLTILSRISAPNARASAALRGRPAQRVRDVRDLPVAQVGKWSPAVSVSLVALQGPLHRFGAHPGGPQARDRLLPREARGKVGDCLLEGQLEVVEGLAEVGRREPRPPQPEGGEGERRIEDDVQREERSQDEL